MLALLASLAFAADVPSLWVRQGVAVSGWPAGLLSNTIAEARTPLHRSESRVFQNTYAGVGTQLQASPAFFTAGARVSLAPIDVFDLNLKAARGWYYGNSLGLLPLDGLTGTLDVERRAREDGVPAGMWIFSAEPTLKAKVWKLVAFDSWAIEHLRIERPAGVDAPYTYEPLRDLVVAWNEFTFEHQAGVLYEVLPGDGGPMLRLGPTYRDRFTLESGDRSAMVGLLVAARPGVKPAVPTLVGLVTWYVIDEERVGPMPYLAGQARWDFDVPFSGKKAEAGG